MAIDERILEAKSIPDAVGVAAVLDPFNVVERWKSSSGEYVLSRTQQAFFDLMRAGASSFLDLGLLSGRNGVIVPTFMECNPWYLVIENAINAAGFAAGSLYTDDTPEKILYKLGDMDAEAIVVDSVRLRGKPSHLDTIIQLHNDLPQLKHVIVVGGIEGIGAPDNLRLIDADDILRGAVSKEHDVDAAMGEMSLDRLLKVIYTSGTTAGTPKGAMLSHGNFLSTVANVAGRLDISKKDRSANFLPHAHIFGSLVYTYFLLAGVKQYYTHKFDLKEDLPAIRPTLFIGVPKVWETFVQKIRDGIGDKLHINNPFMRSLLGRHYDAFIDYFYRKKVPQNRDAILGAIGLQDARYLISGAAYHPRKLLEALHVLFGRDIDLGYGPTESTAAVSINSGAEGIPFSTGGHPSIGQPFPHVRLCVVDESGRDTPEGQVGELVIYGPGNFSGYINDPNASAGVLKHGGVCVGDLALRENGNFFVLGRGGDYRKLRDGEFHHMPTLAERLRGRYANVVIATEVGEKTVAIVTVDYNPVNHGPLLEGLGILGDDQERFYSSRLIKAVRKEVLAALGKIQEDTSIIAPAEKFDCVIYYRPPSPANEELTAGAPKVIEKRILERCMPALEELVKSGKRFGVYNPYAQLIFKG